MGVGTTGFEIAKLIAQFIGAGLIAWFAVRLALSRYKTEKKWERRLTAYVDAVFALAEMRQMIRRWMDSYVQNREPSEEQEAILLDRYQSARRKLDEGVAVGLMVLPWRTANLLSDFVKDFDAAQKGDSWFEVLDSQHVLINAVISKIVEIGRADIGAGPMEPPAITG